MIYNKYASIMWRNCKIPLQEASEQLILYFISGIYLILVFIPWTQYLFLRSSLRNCSITEAAKYPEFFHFFARKVLFFIYFKYFFEYPRTDTSKEQISLSAICHRDNKCLYTFTFLRTIIGCMKLLTKLISNS